MPFVTDAELKASLADILQLEGGSPQLLAWWDSQITDGNRDAYNDLVASLSAQGYTAAQIAAWDQGVDFQKSIGQYYVLNKGLISGKFPAESEDAILRLDRRPELAAEDFQVTNGGVVVEPGEEAGVPGSGRISFGRTRNATDRHTMQGDGVRRDINRLNQGW